MNNFQRKICDKKLFHLNAPLNAQGSLVIAMPNNQIALPTYFIELQQEGTILQLNEEEAKCLTVDGVNVVTETDEIKLFSCEEEKTIENDATKYPLGSTENPIQILHDGEKLVSTQNISKAQLQLIADALQVKQTETIKSEDPPANDFIYRVVYPEELDLKRVLADGGKRGRPKKRPPAVVESTTPAVKVPLKNVRTRSGRITRPPRHIEKDFKKIEISEHDENETELVTTDFAPLPPTHSISETSPKLIEPLKNFQKKRNISSQYRCPKCQKAYMGKSRMIQHIQKYPDHGPIPKHCKDNNFETWNFLVDTIQKCPINARGTKFCEELSNLFQNLNVLTKVLFKPTNETSNCVKIDKVLGNALNLTPGNYKFSENELHRDVKMLNILEDGKLFRDAFLDKSNDKNEIKEQGKSNAIKKEISTKTANGNDLPTYEKISNKDIKNVACNEQIKNNLYENTYLNNDVNLNLEKHNDTHKIYNQDGKKVENLLNINLNEMEKVNDTHKIYRQDDNEKNLLHGDLLSDNSLLNSLPNLRNSVDELMLPVDTGHVSNLLDNSISSDEVMNVDQFVNERFKKITEPDLELTNTMHLDLHTLDLFNFHAS